MVFLKGSPSSAPRPKKGVLRPGHTEPAPGPLSSRGGSRRMPPTVNGQKDRWPQWTQLRCLLGAGLGLPIPGT